MLNTHKEINSSFEYYAKTIQDFDSDNKARLFMYGSMIYFMHQVFHLLLTINETIKEKGVTIA